ncbi:hypothetical protein [Sulfurospirillum arcachonense]|uniref:hypothetical protein n=1 Tax=Sulfurospirillum arcachonense TaxID=57666 RepID=UPI000468A3E2|nr:hypothetical protein [Sulfurospirillum arcachonense]
MDQLFPVLFVSVLIAFILMKQIKHITGNLDERGDVSEFEQYSTFSIAIQNHIRAIKLDIDSTKKIENPRYILLNKEKEEDLIELLSDFLRKLVFFETLLAKSKTSSEIESELFGILSQLDTFIKENCENGELLADELRDNLLEEYENY